MNKIIEMKATGEIITFVHSSADCVEMLVTLPASGEGPPAHRHVLQSEKFEAVKGRLGLDCGDSKIVLEPGQSFTVPVNTFHRCYAVGGEEANFKASFSPGLSIEYLLTEMFAASNRKNAKEPSPFDACYVLRQAKGEYYLKDFPLFIQQLLFPLIAMMGNLFGLVKANPNKK